MSSSDPQKPQVNKPPAAAPVTQAAANPATTRTETKGATPVLKTPGLFRRIDWVTFWVTSIIVLAGYLYTLAPDVTLEDSGELAVGSFYAGVPHPPGYPIWTVYTWLFTVLFPFSNIAWRVALSSAVAGAFSCGLLALVVSRGSSMILESIQDFKNLDRKLEEWICIIAGIVAGALMGFNGFMWSQAVIVEVYTFSVLSFMGVLVFLLRWLYNPAQLRYLYWAAFMFGICLNNHQTLIVAAMGIEVLILAAQPKLGRDLFFLNTCIWIFGLIAKKKGWTAAFDNTPVFVIYNIVGIGSAAISGYLIVQTQKVFTEWKAVLISGLAFVVGVLFYFYMPLASMTNPPMNWGYPRTQEGFKHAITRGQYDKTNPTESVGKLAQQIWMYVEGTSEEFNLASLMIGLLPFVFYAKIQKREGAWLIGLTPIYLLLAILLLILLNPQVDKQSKEQARVFFAASHVIVAIAIGYGIALIGGLLATQYAQTRRYFLVGSAIAVAIALYSYLTLEVEYPLNKINAIFGIVLAAAAVLVFWLFSPGNPLLQKYQRLSAQGPLPAVLGLFLLMPFYSVFDHWADNEQRGHYFGWYFGHDMFTPPYEIYPEMPKNAILFGGTDPGRFNPTYMIFCESFTPPNKKRDPKFDRRDVYLITQNALADSTYLMYIRGHYNRSAQKDPPFFLNLFRSEAAAFDGRTNFLGKVFTPVDRYFTKLGARIEKERRKDGIYPPQENPVIPPGVENDPYDVGAYYSKEIYTPSDQDSGLAFQQYIADAQRRLQHDMTYPNEPKQIKPGEDVRLDNGRVSVSGQVAVMAINGLLTKVIFDKNPTNEFFIEESFPLDWMFPYLTPYGIIMKINRNPVPEITEEMINKDHEFWSRYSERMIGNWIKYETPVKEICDFVEKIHLRRDFSGFKGDETFVRDDNAQKAFSKLRSAIGGVYFWRVNNSKNAAENQRMIKEAEFAFKQAFAYCPYSPEAVYKYITLLINMGRAGEAEQVVRTSIKFDPDNPNMHMLLQNIIDIKQGQTTGITPQTQLSLAESQYQQNPTNLQAAFQLASLYLQSQRSNDAIRVLDSLISTNSDVQTLLSVANAYSQLQHTAGLEKALEALTKVAPENPETWYDLSVARMAMNKIPASLQTLQKAITMSNERLKTNPAARNLAADALTNQNFSAMRTLPEFMRIVGQ
ncbi:MAG: protein O-mannosyl-transferase family [Verrucomicrobiales bacterium]